MCFTAASLLTNSLPQLFHPRSHSNNLSHLLECEVQSRNHFISHVFTFMFTSKNIMKKCSIYFIQGVTQIISVRMHLHAPLSKFRYMAFLIFHFQCSKLFVESHQSNNFVDLSFSNMNIYLITITSQIT